ncbi:hypothetical protein RR48_12755 [Papilio machaon]|uniref:Uncharacterized protein n=1 Tax=Papilio machaon TaxID=76193 RepID=A0A194QQY0_PAPMA|nr:hypothetical protein RR48_12755 [Papilio machaon]
MDKVHTVRAPRPLASSLQCHIPFLIVDLVSSVTRLLRFIAIAPVTRIARASRLAVACVLTRSGSSRRGGAGGVSDAGDLSDLRWSPARCVIPRSRVLGVDMAVE